MMLIEIFKEQSARTTAIRMNKAKQIKHLTFERAQITF